MASFLLCVEGETDLSARWPLSQLRRSIEANDEPDAQNAAAGEGDLEGEDMEMSTDEDGKGDVDTEEEARPKKRARKSVVDASKHNSLIRGAMFAISD